MNDWAERYQAYAAVFSAGLTLCGLVVIFFQLRQTNKTIQAQNDTLATEIDAKLCELSYEILKILAEDKNLYRLFYYNEALTADSSLETKAKCVAEMTANYMENLVHRKGSMSDDKWKSWDDFICDSYKKSPVLRLHFDERGSWYAPELMKIVERCKVNLKKSI